MTLSERPSLNCLIHFYKRCVSRGHLAYYLYSGLKKVHKEKRKYSDIVSQLRGVVKLEATCLTIFIQD